MAKKKLTHHHHQENESAMDEVSEKLENLKSLNAMLLKETVERRQQVDSLMQSKGSLESELTRSNSGKEVLRSELTQLSEGFLRLEVERDVMFVFVAQQAEVIERERDGVERKMKGFEREMGEILRERSELEEMKSEKEREIELLNEKLKELGFEIEKERGFSNGVCLERDEMKAKLDIQINDTNVLGRKLIEGEKRERYLQGEVEKLRAQCSLMVKEKEEWERQIKSLMRDKELLEKCLMEVNKEVEELRGDIEGIVKEKEEIEAEKNVELTKRSQLENVVSGLNAMVGSLRKEDERLRVNIAELEKKCVEGEVKERAMGREIDELVKEKDERDKRLLKVLEEKCMVGKELDEVLTQLDEVKVKMEEIVYEKSEISDAKVRKESEIVELEKQVAELRKVVLGLEDCCKVQKGEIIGLESEVRSYVDLFERVSTDRDNALKEFKEEKQNVMKLQEKIKVMENNVEESSKFVEKMKAENANIREKKEDLESRCNLLKEEIASAENELAEARKQLHAMKAKVELADTNSEQILKVLRSTAELVCPKEDDINATVGDDLVGTETNGEVEPYVAELEAIKIGFKSRETKLEDMKRQLEFLQNSVAEAHKKKSLWTVISSATTLCAAISLAYVARGH